MADDRPNITEQGRTRPLPPCGGGLGWGVAPVRASRRGVERRGFSGTTPTSGPSPQGGGEKPAIAGLVLMGGRASRLGGGDKALIDLAGRPILAHALERFARQVGAVALSANGDPARLSAFGLPLLADPADGPEGPLAGVRAGLAWAKKLAGVTHLATIPGDAPSPPDDLVARLFSAGGGGPASAATADGVEPLHALWPVERAEELDRLVRDGVASPRRALGALGAAQALYPSRDGFRDIDTPADLASAQFWFRNA